MSVKNNSFVAAAALALGVTVAAGFPVAEGMLNDVPVAGLKAAETIVALGAVALVTGECGVKALHALHRAGVKVYSTDSTTFDDALEDLRQGNLREAQPA